MAKTTTKFIKIVFNDKYFDDGYAHHTHLPALPHVAKIIEVNEDGTPRSVGVKAGMKSRHTWVVFDYHFSIVKSKQTVLIYK